MSMSDRAYVSRTRQAASRDSITPLQFNTKYNTGRFLAAARPGLSNCQSCFFSREIGLVSAMNCGLISPLAVACFWAYFVNAANFLGLYVRGTFNLVQMPVENAFMLTWHCLRCLCYLCR